jgi:hypothetical protein
MRLGGVPIPRKQEPTGDGGDGGGADKRAYEDLQLWRHRLDRMLDLGFGFEDAEQLVFALSSTGRDWHYVKEQLLDRGCTLDEAKEILL